MSSQICGPYVSSSQCCTRLMADSISDPDDSSRHLPMFQRHFTCCAQVYNAATTAGVFRGDLYRHRFILTALTFTRTRGLSASTKSCCKSPHAARLINRQWLRAHSSCCPEPRRSSANLHRVRRGDPRRCGVDRCPNRALGRLRLRYALMRLSTSHLHVWSYQD